VEYSYEFPRSGKKQGCTLDVRSVHTRHVTDADFALLMLAGELEPFPLLTGDLRWPKWCTNHWSKEGHFVCTCGNEETTSL
jgi:hypothetical protein